MFVLGLIMTFLILFPPLKPNFVKGISGDIGSCCSNKGPCPLTRGDKDVPKLAKLLS